MNPILSVSSVNAYVSFKLKNDPKLKGIAVSGEISDVSINHSSGHMYFTLTDQKSSIRAIMFSSNVERLKFYPEAGLSVIAFGGIDVYEKSGVYQLNCTQLLPSGRGADYIRLAQLKDELAQKGVFSKSKKQIKEYPSKIAVVTSPTGAAVKDVISVAKRRYPLVKIELFPAVVQGIEAPGSIAGAIALADASGADTIILTRGGGSNEDLSCFNAREVVMAVYNCKTPVVSAVGHEIDVCLCDLVADLRAPTPSGAAELCTPDINDIFMQIRYMKERISEEAIKKMSAAQRSIMNIKDMLSVFSPERKLKSIAYEVQSYKMIISSLYTQKLKRLENDAAACRRLISSFNPMNIISRGYALIYKADGGSSCKDKKLVTSADAVSVGDRIEIILKDGSVKAKISDAAGKENDAS